MQLGVPTMLLVSVAISLALAVKFANIPTDFVKLTLLSPVASAISLIISLIVLYTSNARSRFGSTFQVAEKWDSSIMIEAREATNALIDKYIEKKSGFYGKTGPELARLERELKEEIIEWLENVPEFRRGIVHYSNFFWGMSAAIETGWASSDYLRLRFGETFREIWPFLEEYLKLTHGAGVLPATRSYAYLNRTWRLGLQVQEVNKVGAETLLERYRRRMSGI